MHIVGANMAIRVYSLFSLRVCVCVSVKQITNSDILKQFIFNSILMDLNYSFTRLFFIVWVPLKCDHDDGCWRQKWESNL